MNNLPTQEPTEALVPSEPNITKRKRFVMFIKRAYAGSRTIVGLICSNIVLIVKIIALFVKNFLYFSWRMLYWVVRTVSTCIWRIVRFICIHLWRLIMFVRGVLKIILTCMLHLLQSVYAFMLKIDKRNE